MRCGVHRRPNASGAPGSSKPSVTSLSGEPPVCGDWAPVGSAMSERPRPNGLDDALDRLVDGHAVVLTAIAEAERDRSGLGILAARDEHERDLVLARGADLLREAIARGVHLRADPFPLEPRD